MATGREEVVIDVFGEIARVLVAGEPVDVVLQLVARGARTLADADLAAVTLVRADGMLFLPALDGPEAELYRGHAFPSENTVTLEVMESGEPVVVADVSARPGAQQRMLGHQLGPAMFMPISLDGPFGSLNVFRFALREPFGEEEASLVHALAAQVSLLLGQNALRERLAVSDRIAQQVRIAAALQDSAVDQIFSASLALSSVVKEVSDGPARERIFEVIEDLDRAIKQIREVAFDLQPKPNADS